MASTKVDKEKDGETKKVLRLVLELWLDRMEHINIPFLISDVSLESGDICTGLPVLKHIGVDSRTWLERNRKQLDGTDWLMILLSSSSRRCVSLSRLMMARLQRSGVYDAAEDSDYSSTSNGESSY